MRRFEGQAYGIASLGTLAMYNKNRSIKVRIIELQESVSRNRLALTRSLLLSRLSCILERFSTC